MGARHEVGFCKELGGISALQGSFASVDKAASRIT
jgi:hypothetical protein